jgi:cytidylate kinase
MSSILQLDEADTVKEIQHRDDERKRLLKTHYRIDSADPEHYDLVCNTDRISIQTISDILLSIMLKEIGQ